MNVDLILKVNIDEATALLNLLARDQNYCLQRIRQCLLQFISGSVPFEGNEFSNCNIRPNIRTTIDPTACFLKKLEDHRSSSVIFEPEATQYLRNLEKEPLIFPKPGELPLCAKNELVGICLSKCHYAGPKELIRSIISCNSKLYEVTWSTMSTASVLWSDHANHSLHSVIQSHQRINFFPQLQAIVTKSNLAKALNLSRKLHTSACFDFFPSTWQLPQDRIAIERAVKVSSGPVIVKPSSGLQGRHIHLTRRWDTIQQLLDRMEPQGKSVIVQSYIGNPMLLNGLKWDMRIYVLVDSLHPLRAFLFDDGLSRFATEPYSCADGNLERSFMHLTNYSLNKTSKSYRLPVDDRDLNASKRRISIVLQQLRDSGHIIETKTFWDNVSNIVNKTLIALWPSLWGSYQSSFSQHPLNSCKCFQLIGFDIMMDDEYKLWLLEVNSSPSFSTETLVDAAIKRSVIQKTLEIITTTTLSCSEKPIGTIKLVPEKLVSLSELFVFKLPFIQSNKSKIEHWRNELSKRRKQKTNSDKIRFSLPERFAMKDVMKQMDNFESETRNAIQLEMRKEIARLFSKGLLQKDVIRLESLKKDLLEESSLTTTDQLIENSDLSIWKLYILNIMDVASPMLCSNKFVRLLSTCRLTDNTTGFSRADADLLHKRLLHTTAKHSTSIVNKSSRNKMGRIMTFELFCEALIDIAIRQFPDSAPADAIRKLMITSLTYRDSTIV